MGELLFVLCRAVSVSPHLARRERQFDAATNNLYTNSPPIAPHPREAGSPCVFVVIYRVSPARLSDCICLRGALLVHTSHPLDSGFPNTQAMRDACPAEVSCCLYVCMCCTVAVGGNVKLLGGLWHLSLSERVLSVDSLAACLSTN